MALNGRLCFPFMGGLGVVDVTTHIWGSCLQEEFHRCFKVTFYRQLEPETDMGVFLKALPWDSVQLRGGGGRVVILLPPIGPVTLNIRVYS